MHRTGPSRCARVANAKRPAARHVGLENHQFQPFSAMPRLQDIIPAFLPMFLVDVDARPQVQLLANEQIERSVMKWKIHQDACEYVPLKLLPLTVSHAGDSHLI